MKEELEQIKQTVNEFGLNKRTRKRETVYKRAYMSIYMHDKGFSPDDIADMLNLFRRDGWADHSVLNHYKKIVSDSILIKDQQFYDYIYDVYMRHPLDDINPRMLGNKMLQISLTGEEYRRLTRYSQQTKVSSINGIKQLIKKYA